MIDGARKPDLMVISYRLRLPALSLVDSAGKYRSGEGKGPLYQSAGKGIRMILIM